MREAQAACKRYEIQLPPHDQSIGGQYTVLTQPIKVKVLYFAFSGLSHLIKRLNDFDILACKQMESTSTYVSLFSPSAGVLLMTQSTYEMHSRLLPLQLLLLARCNYAIVDKSPASWYGESMSSRVFMN